MPFEKTTDVKEVTNWSYGSNKEAPSGEAGTEI